MSDTLKILGVALTILGLVVTGFMVLNYHEKQDIEVMEQYLSDAEEDILILIVFANSHQEMEKKVLKAYPNYDIIAYDEDDGTFIVQIKKRM